MDPFGLGRIKSTYVALEVIDSRGKVKAALNLDGSLNAKKTEAALKQRRSVKW